MCAGMALLEFTCAGHTSQKLPHFNLMRLENHLRFSWIRGGNQANGRSTGRPRKDRAKFVPYRVQEFAEDE